MKQRMAIFDLSPSRTGIRHTIVRPSRLGALMTAPSGSSYDLPSMRAVMAIMAFPIGVDYRGAAGSGTTPAVSALEAIEP
jgi:hypothetical protein